MVTDQASHMRELQHSVWAGVAYTLPLLIWSLLQLQNVVGSESTLNTLQSSISVAVIIQAIVVSLYIPRLQGNATSGETLSAILMLISIPWPFFALAWLVGAITINTISVSQGGLILYALLLFAATRALIHINLQSTNKNLVLSGLQLTAITLVILFPSEWIMEAGL